MERRMVVDALGRRVGAVTRDVRDRRTGARRSLVVKLTPEAHAALGTSAPHAVLRARLVAALRADVVVLDRSLEEAARSGDIALSVGLPPALL